MMHGQKNIKLIRRLYLLSKKLVPCVETISFRPWRD